VDGAVPLPLLLVLVLREDSSLFAAGTEHGRGDGLTGRVVALRLPLQLGPDFVVHLRPHSQYLMTLGYAQQ
jgi:hypothetical protein